MILVLRTLWPYLRRHRRLLILASAAMVGEIVTGLLMPWPLKFIFDSVLFVRGKNGKPQLAGSFGHHALVLLVLFSLAAVAIAVFDGLFSYVEDRTTDIVAQRSIYELRRSLFSHLQHLSLAFHEHIDTRLGDLLSRLSGDVGALEDLAASGVPSLVTNGIGLVAMVTIMFLLNWQLAGVAVALTLPMYFVTRRTTNRMRRALRVARRQEGRVTSVLQESLASIKLVQAFGREDHEEERLARETTKSLEANLQVADLQSRLSPAITILSTVATGGVTAFGVYLTVKRTISPGELLIFLGYLRGMQSPIRQLAKLSYAVSKASTGMERINATFAETLQVADRPGAVEMTATTGGVRFEGVTFGYGINEPTLRDVRLAVEPGQIVAVVGATGSGKSTLLSLLPRFYDPWVGRILIDDRDVREYTLGSLRAHIALVLQDSLIFRTTIRDNIAYGRPGASDADIEAAGEAAGVGVICRRFEQGYDTVVSERGSSLSGGEKQCIGIARALLKDAPIVILDEPTSAMDSLTESLVMDGIARLTRGRTTFMIAHRLATIRHADVVAVVQDGTIVETGTPNDLLSRESIFAGFARTQGLVADPIEPPSVPTRRRPPTSLPAQRRPAPSLPARRRPAPSLRAPVPALPSMSSGRPVSRATVTAGSALPLLAATAATRMLRRVPVLGEEPASSAGLRRWGPRR